MKLTFACPVSLKADLDRYAALHVQAYGEANDATTLITHMLGAFMVGDRGFRKGDSGKAAPPKPSWRCWFPLAAIPRTRSPKLRVPRF
ncbi:DUF2274 domain-containing protein [Enterobacter ludwigii]|uniref:DUF2274 domain-containing protein n=1 Tax=Enterobacter ludwigii TaxID=299767 RepID=UPI003D1BA1D6